METLLYIIVILFFFVISALFSGFETGIISLDRFKLEHEAKKNKLKKKILYFYDNSDKTFGTTLIGNNIGSVIVAATATYYINTYYELNSFYVSLIIAFLFLVFCEIIPKSMFRDYPNKLVDTFFPLINAIYIFLKPLVSIVTFLNNQMRKLYKIDEQNSYMAFTKDDLAFIVEETYIQGNLPQPQKEMIEDALDFSELEARNVMRPRTEIIAIPDTMLYDEILKVVRLEGYTRYPVYTNTLDEITGVLIIYDLLEEKNRKRTANELKREMYFVPESMDVNVILKEMQEQKKSIAIVVDAYGGTSGLLTIEDILEEIVGEIDDEYDTEEIKEVVKINETTWLVNGYVKVDTLIDDFGIDIPEGDYETIAGLIINTLANIPSQGQKIRINNYIFEIIEVTNKKIKKVKISS